MNARAFPTNTLTCTALVGGVAVAALALTVGGFQLVESPAPVSPPPGDPAADSLEIDRAALRAACFQGDLAANAYFGDRRLEDLRSAVAESPEDASLLCRLATEELRAGNHDEALRLCEQAAGLETPYEGFDGFLTWRLAMAALRKAESENCVARHFPESCIFPLRDRAVHVSRAGAEGARDYLKELLAADDLDDLDRWRSRWLLNVAANALDAWPQAVPEVDRLPTDPFAPQAGTLARFDNLARERGLEKGFTAGGGVVLDDFDADGDLDVLVSGWLPEEGLRLFANDGSGSFEEITDTGDLARQPGAIRLHQADYDNDGLLDLLVVRGGQPDPEETPLTDDGRRARNSLLRNLGDGAFEDVTLAAGLGTSHAPWSTAAWADYDGDGHLDLYVAAQGDEARFPDRLYRNRGDGRFEDVAPQVGIRNASHAMAAVWGDYDDDGDPDLFIANYGSFDRLYRNDDGVFVDVGNYLGVSGYGRSHGGWFLDADGDGLLDLLVTSFGAAPGEAAAEMFGAPLGGPVTHLYLNRGVVGFEDVTGQWGLDRTWMSWSGNVGDLDGDGFEDFYLGTGGVGFDALFPNVVLRNDAGRGFVDETLSSDMGHLQKASGVAFGDVDGDGNRDLVLRVGGCYKADGFMNVMFVNPGHGNRWLTLDLQGRRSNRAAVGARVSVTVTDAQGDARTVRRWVGSGGAYGSSTLRLEIGLGSAQRVEALEVRWPGGDTERFGGARLDSTMTLVEGSGDVEMASAR